MSCVVDYNENEQPGPGEIQVSFEFLSRYSEFKVNVLDIRDLKLPTGMTNVFIETFFETTSGLI